MANVCFVHSTMTKRETQNSCNWFALSHFNVQIPVSCTHFNILYQNVFWSCFFMQLLFLPFNSEHFQIDLLCYIYCVEMLIFYFKFYTQKSSAKTVIVLFKPVNIYVNILCSEYLSKQRTISSIYITLAYTKITNILSVPMPYSIHFFLSIRFFSHTNLQIYNSYTCVW